MSYFYVKNSLGTRTTGGGLTIQSGSFATLGAASVYATIALAIADGAGAGDIICLSDAHAFSSGSNITHAGPTSGDFLRIQTVADLNCDQSAIASTVQERTTVAADMAITGRIHYTGVPLLTVDNFTAATNACAIFENSKREGTGANDIVTPVNYDGASYYGAETEHVGISGTVMFLLGSGGLIDLTGGGVSGGATYLTNGGFTAGGGTFLAKGTDLSSVNGVLFQGVGAASTADDAIAIRLDDCPIHASASYLNEEFENLNQRLEAYGCASTSLAAEYSVHVEAYGGVVDHETDANIHRDETTAYPSGTKTSLKILTNAKASLGAPFWFELSSRFAKLATASTDKLRFYLTSETPLDDTDVWIEVLYADGTSKHIRNFITTRNAERMTVASAGVALDTDSSSTWKDGASTIAGTFYRYQIDVDTSGDVGADCVPTIRFYAAIPSTTIYLDPVLDVVA